MIKYLVTGLVLSITIFFKNTPVQAAPADSIGTVKVNGVPLIRHQVTAKETIYSVARKYGVAVAKIKQVNPDLKTLQIGQVILVPFAASFAKKEPDAHLTKTAVPKGNRVLVSSQPIGPALFDAQGNGVHQVDKQQTLFSIARQYGVSINDLKKWNNLPDNTVQNNQTLIVKPHEQTAKTNTNPEVSPVKPVKPESTAVATNPVVVARPETVRADNPVAQPEETEAAAAPRQSFSLVTESGLAELISEGKSGSKYLALHRTAPVGSFITVRNLMNNQAVSVRVIGKLPEIGTNDKVVVKVSKRAYQRLGALDKRFMVEVQYEAADKILSSNR
ncbi:LysM peptidoglycan-binding domain-containing protein [Adhaeribacter swui]|uniref:LysM peptidoglycan-binding domain-containing protein n=1 Tax=Adhaeribacter swui TaxID=2086471 RepID=A0A7G7G2N8_9BACT|nr:LysM peptidoglycan-binding domain-containing protein [Adhaeribacter swui]QNF31422.1 LysM peptidoglycan-binding domain-containing protein [Adhaeribacter swui]